MCVRRTCKLCDMTCIYQYIRFAYIILLLKMSGAVMDDRCTHTSLRGGYVLFRTGAEFLVKVGWISGQVDHISGQADYISRNVHFDHFQNPKKCVK